MRRRRSRRSRQALAKFWESRAEQGTGRTDGELMEGLREARARLNGLLRSSGGDPQVVVRVAYGLARLAKAEQDAGGDERSKAEKIFDTMHQLEDSFGIRRVFPGDPGYEEADARYRSSAELRGE